jgi:hypothetical protein
MRKCYFLIVFIWVQFSAKSQVLNSFIDIDSVIIRLYGINEYPSILQDTIKYGKINYYFKHSFILEKVACTDCAKLDVNAFNVLPYESLRKETTRYVRIYDKYGFKLTLLAKNELLSLMPIQEF